jgi:acetyl esterase/lipase
MTPPLKILLLLLIPCLIGISSAQSESPTERATSDDRLDAILKRFPQSDTDQDGTLSRQEALAFFRQRREGMEAPQGRPKANARDRVAPTYADVSYGTHPKQAFDLWTVPEATQPTPLVVFIHGGGFRSGDKTAVPANVIQQYLNAGVAFAAMNYRLSDVGPYPIMMEDAARGLQTLRHQASEWNLNPEKVACYGGSAGAGISLWLAFHDDLANPASDDPVSRQSTRIVAAGTMNGQSTYDLRDFREWFGLPDLQPGPALPAFYDVKSDTDWESDRVQGLMAEASSIHHLSKDDVPVYMIYSRPNTEVTLETDSSVWVHHVKLGLKLQEAMNQLDLECLVTGPDVTPDTDPYESLESFLIQKLTQ